jgi:hypothetical protein
VNKDEIDLSAFPSYLGVRAGAAQVDDARPPEAVAAGLVAAFVVGMVGVVLGAVVSRQIFMPEALSPVTGGFTSAAMVLLYRRAAGAAPRRGLIPLAVLFLVVLAATFVAIIAAKAWWVYSLMQDEMGLTLPFSRADFVWDTVSGLETGGVLGVMLFQLIMFSIAGFAIVLWKVRRRATG